MNHKVIVIPPKSLCMVQWWGNGVPGTSFCYFNHINHLVLKVKLRMGGWLLGSRGPEFDGSSTWFQWDSLEGSEIY